MRAAHKGKLKRSRRSLPVEAAKGLRLLDLMAQRYDVVVTNPPYMSARKMNAKLKSTYSSKLP